MGIIVLLHFLTHVLIRIAWDSLPACEWTKQMRRERGLPNLPPATASVPPLLNRMLTRTELWCVNMCFVRFRHLPNIQARRVKLKFLQSWRLFFVKKKLLSDRPLCKRSAYPDHPDHLQEKLSNLHKTGSCSVAGIPNACPWCPGTQTKPHQCK